MINALKEYLLNRLLSADSQPAVVRPKALFSQTRKFDCTVLLAIRNFSNNLSL